MERTNKANKVNIADADITDKTVKTNKTNTIIAEEKLPDKVLLLYQAVAQLFQEGMSPEDLKVIDITQRAGIGKGTAYEYFDTKEEIIAGSLLYNMKRMMKRIEQQISMLTDFHSRISLLLGIINEEFGERECFIKYMQLTGSVPSVNQALRQAIESQGANECVPERILFKIIKDAKERGEIGENHPAEYCVYSIGAKLLCYAMMRTSTNKYMRVQHSINDDQIKELIFDGIKRELE